MNRRNFIRSALIGLIAGPTLLKRALAAPTQSRRTHGGTASLFEPVTWITINGTTYKATEIRVNGQRGDLSIIDQAP